MSAPQQRRRDPQPLSHGWEMAVIATAGVVAVVGLAAVAGLGIASALFGRGWVWPHGTDTIGRVIGGLCAGHPGRGLNPRQAPLVADPTAVYLCVAACELTVVAASLAGGVLIARYRRPGDARSGMATRGEAAQVLGVARLRSARTIIRPDLYPTQPNQRR